MPTVTQINPSSAVKTTFNEDTFLVQKLFGNKYKIIDLERDEAAKVYTALGVFLMTGDKAS
jgi:hypothetical protein